MTYVLPQLVIGHDGKAMPGISAASESGPMA